MTEFEINEIMTEYEEQAFDFTNGYHVPEEECKKYIHDCIKRVSERFDADPFLRYEYSSSSCGNLYVCVHANKVEGGEYQYEIIVSRSRKECNVRVLNKNYMYRI